MKTTNTYKVAVILFVVFVMAMFTNCMKEEESSETDFKVVQVDSSGMKLFQDAKKELAKGNYVPAKAKLELAAKREYDSAKLFLGYMYEYGIGVKQDLGKAQEYYAGVMDIDLATEKVSALTEKKVNSQMTLPKDSKVEVKDVILVCGDTVQMANGDGSFNTSANVVTACNKNGELVYMSYKHPNAPGIELSAKETAVTLLMMYVPRAFELNEDALAKLKSKIRTVEGFEGLAQKIEKEIKDKGFFELDKIKDAMEKMIPSIYDVLLGDISKSGALVGPGSMVEIPTVPEVEEEQEQEYTKWNDGNGNYVMLSKNCDYGNNSIQTRFTQVSFDSNADVFHTRIKVRSVTPESFSVVKGTVDAKGKFVPCYDNNFDEALNIVAGIVPARKVAAGDGILAKAAYWVNYEVILWKNYVASDKYGSAKSDGEFSWNSFVKYLKEDFQIFATASNDAKQENYHEKNYLDVDVASNQDALGVYFPWNNKYILAYEILYTYTLPFYSILSEAGKVDRTSADVISNTRQSLLDNFKFAGIVSKTKDELYQYFSDNPPSSLQELTFDVMVACMKSESWLVSLAKVSKDEASYDDKIKFFTETFKCADDVLLIYLLNRTKLSCVANKKVKATANVLQDLYIDGELTLNNFKDLEAFFEKKLKGLSLYADFVNLLATDIMASWDKTVNEYDHYVIPFETNVGKRVYNKKSSVYNIYPENGNVKLTASEDMLTMWKGNLYTIKGDNNLVAELYGRDGDELVFIIYKYDGKPFQQNGVAYICLGAPFEGRALGSASYKKGAQSVKIKIKINCLKEFGTSDSRAYQTGFALYYPMTLTDGYNTRYYTEPLKVWAKNKNSGEMFWIGSKDGDIMSYHNGVAVKCSGSGNYVSGDHSVSSTNNWCTKYVYNFYSQFYGYNLSGYPNAVDWPSIIPPKYPLLSNIKNANWNARPNMIIVYDYANPQYKYGHIGVIFEAPAWQDGKMGVKVYEQNAGGTVIRWIPYNSNGVLYDPKFKNISLIGFSNGNNTNTNSNNNTSTYTPPTPTTVLNFTKWEEPNNVVELGTNGYAISFATDHTCTLKVTIDGNSQQISSTKGVISLPTSSVSPSLHKVTVQIQKGSNQTVGDGTKTFSYTVEDNRPPEPAITGFDIYVDGSGSIAQNSNAYAKIRTNVACDIECRVDGSRIGTYKTVSTQWLDIKLPTGVLGEHTVEIKATSEGGSKSDKRTYVVINPEPIYGYASSVESGDYLPGIGKAIYGFPRLHTYSSSCLYNTDKTFVIRGSNHCDPVITATFDAGDGKNATITINKDKGNNVFQLSAEMYLVTDVLNLDNYIDKITYSDGTKDARFDIDLQKITEKTKLFVVIKTADHVNWHNGKKCPYDYGFYLGPLILNAKDKKTTYTYKTYGLTSSGYLPDAPSSIKDIVATNWEDGFDGTKEVEFTVNSTADCDVRVKCSVNGSKITLTGSKEGGYNYPGTAYVYQGDNISKFWKGNILETAHYEAGQYEFKMTVDVSYLTGKGNKLCVVLKPDNPDKYGHYGGYRTDFITIDVL